MCCNIKLLFVFYQMFLFPYLHGEVFDIPSNDNSIGGPRRKIDPELSRLAFEALMHNNELQRRKDPRYSTITDNSKSKQNPKIDSKPSTFEKKYLPAEILREKINIPLKPNSFGEIEFPVPRFADPYSAKRYDPKMDENVKNELNKWILKNGEFRKKFHSVDKPVDFGGKILGKQQKFDENDEPWKSFLKMLK